MESRSLYASIVLTLGAVLPASQAPAQQVYSAQFQQQTIATDPKTWPAVFDGTRAGGPYAWVDGATALKNDPKLANAVQGGQQGQVRLYICRATLKDGVHVGKYFNRICNIGWGGAEVTVANPAQFQILVNTRPELAPFLSQKWVAPSAQSAYVGGVVGKSGLRVCRAKHPNAGVHPGKEWQGRCNYGYGGKEIVAASYEVLQLGFDKTAWSKAQAPAQQVHTAPQAPTQQGNTATFVQSAQFQQQTIVTSDPRTWPALFDGTRPGGPYAWVPFDSYRQKDPSLSAAVLLHQEGSNRLFFCRRDYLKYGKVIGLMSGNQCGVAWKGSGETIVSGMYFEILVNTRPELAPFLSQKWVAPSAKSAFVDESTGVRVCRTRHTDGKIRLGQEWQQGVCTYPSMGPQTTASYEVLQLGFDKTAWSNSSSARTVSGTSVTIGSSPGVNDAQVVFSTSGTVTKQKIDTPQQTQVDAGRARQVTLGPFVVLSTGGQALKSRATREAATNGTPVVFDGYGGEGNYFTNPWVYFQKEDRGGGWFRLRYAGTNYCVDIKSGNRYQENSPVHLWTCHDGASQKWGLGDEGAMVSAVLPEDWQRSADSQAITVLDLLGYSGYRLCVNAADNGSAYVRQCRHGNWAAWRVIDIPRQTYLSPN